MDTVRLETMAQTSAITASSVASANMKAITAQMKLRTRCVFVLFSVRSGLTGLDAAGFALARFALADACDLPVAGPCGWRVFA